MNKYEFMNSLKSSLSDFSSEERTEIIYDYEEHFSIGLESGKSEEEICGELGEPTVIAKQYKVNSSIDRASSNPSTGNIFRAVVASLSLGLLNLIFVLGPFLVVASVLFSLFITSLALTFAGIVATFSIILHTIFPGYVTLPTFIPWISIVLYGIGLTILGILLFMLMSYLSKLFLKVTLKYLKINANIISGRR